MILETKVWCSEDDEAKKMGLPDGDAWMPISFDLDKVDTIREAGYNDFVGEGKATIYIGGVHFTINMEYRSVVKIWKEYNER